MKTVEVRHPLVQHKIGLLRDAALGFYPVSADGLIKA